MVFKDFIKIFKKCTAEPYFFWLIILGLHQIILKDLEKIFSTYNKIMIVDDQNRDEKLRYNINREAAKKSTLSSGKIDKYEYLRDEEILSSNQQQVIE